MSIFKCNHGIFNCCDCDDTEDQINIIAPALTTTVVDSLSLSEFDSVLWQILIIDPTLDKRKRQMVSATHEDSITPIFHISNVVGSKKQFLDYEIEVDINLGSFRLKVINNSTNDYLVEIIRDPTLVYTP